MTSDDTPAPVVQPGRKKIRPHVHRTQLDKAVARIIAGRRKMEDTKFADTVDLDDPHSILAHVTRHPPSTRHHPDIALTEPFDAQILANWNWWLALRQDHTLVTQMRRAGANWTQIGAEWGLGREGARTRYATWTALLNHHRPDATLHREDRKVDRARAERGDRQAAWLATYREYIATVVDDVLRHKGPYTTDDIDSDLIEIQHDRDDNLTWTVGGMTFLSMGVQALRIRTAAAGLSTQHRLQRALCKATLLAEAFASLADPTKDAP